MQFEKYFTVVTTTADIKSQNIRAQKPKRNKSSIMSENSSRSANKSYRRPTGSSSRSLVKAKPSTLSSQSSSKIVKHDGGESDIWRASEMGKASEVNRLLKKGANPNELTARKKTPLHYACIGAKLEIVEILIKAGADKRLQDDFGKSALDYCKMFSEESKYGKF